MLLINYFIQVRPSASATSTSVNSSPSTPLSLIPTSSSSNPPSIQRAVSSNIIVASNNHPNMPPARSHSNILPSRTNVCINKYFNGIKIFNLIVTIFYIYESNSFITSIIYSNSYYCTRTKTSTSFTFE